MTKQTGFTIIELMITIAVAAVVLGIGVPSFLSVIQSNRTATEVNKIVTAFNLARAEAVGRGLAVTVLPLTAGDWNDGWQVGIDMNEDGDFVDGGAELTIQVYDAVIKNTLDSDAGRLRFQPTGAAVAAEQFTLTPEKCTSANPPRQIAIGLSGIVDVDELACP
jgi:type IV fimbrial biogenesis protein FimT